MKHLVERMISTVLAAALVFCTALPVWAAGEDASLQDVIVSASLDVDTFTVGSGEHIVKFILKTDRPVSMNELQADLTVAEPLKIEDLSGIGGDNHLTMYDNYHEGSIYWKSTEIIQSSINLVEATFRVPASIEVGTYKIEATNIGISNEKEDGQYINLDGVCATLTITEAPKAVGYTASATAVTKEITVADKAEVSVSVSHATDKNFAAGELVLRYDSDMLTFNKEASYIGTAQVKDVDGVLTLEDYGEEKTLGDSVYKLAFTPKKDGPATVTLKSAAFVNKTDAAKRDLIKATVSPETVQFSIGKRRYKVTIDSIFTGLSEVEEGTSYTFTATDPKNYTYESVTATMGEGTAKVTDNKDGTYTIADVIGDVHISGSRTPKSYDVTFAGNAVDEFKDAANIATYGTDYKFTMPTSDEYAYSLEKITIGEKEYTGYTVAEDKPIYTISGTAVTGEICITVNKTQTAVKVDVNGDGAGAAAGNTVIAKLGEDYVLTLTPEAGYNYTVTATMGGKEVEVLNNGNNIYTIKKVTNGIVFTVKRTVKTDGVTVQEYFGIDGGKAWLILNKTEVADKKVPTYDNTPMFWSDKYKAYCYLVMAQTLEDAEVENKIGIIDGTAKSVDYGMDVNMTGTVDASDAQLVYNIYNVVYNGFTSDDMTMEKFLRADVNGDKEVNVTDAAAIISHLLKLETESQ